MALLRRVNILCLVPLLKSEPRRILIHTMQPLIEHQSPISIKETCALVHLALGSDGFWDRDYGWGVRVCRPFGARGRSSVRYGTRLGDLKRVGLFCFPIKDSTHTPHGPCHSGNGLCHVTGGRNHPKGIFLMVPNLVRASSPT